MRLRSSLLLLSFATALPVIAFALLAAGVVVQDEHDNFIRSAKARNRATMGAVEAEMRGAVSALQALTVSRALVSDDLELFHSLAKSVLATQPSWNNLLLHDPSGRQLVNASLPWGSALLAQPVAPRSIAEAVQRLEPAFDDLTEAPRLNNQLGVPVRVPIVRDGKAVYVITAVIAPHAFQQLLIEEKLPPGWVSGLVDRQGRLIARVPAKAPGTLASPGYLARTGAADEGWYRGRTLEGDDTYTSFLRSELTGWTIGYAIPANEVLATALRAAWLMGAGIVLSLVAALLIAFGLGRRISGPMSDLAGSATALGSGAIPLPVRSKIAEVAQLSQALTDAARGIGERDGEIRRTAAELRQHADELQLANEKKSQFLALLSHELRNPLAPLRNGLALLRLQPEPRALAQTQAMMERQVAHLSRLIDDLLDVSRIDRGLLELRRERVPLDAAIESAIETVQPAVLAREQQLVIHRASEPLYVDGDPVRLAQIFSNLLNNAAKFTPVGGRIELDVRADDGEAVVSVRDTGVGFGADEHERIFELFVQLDPSRTQAAGGLGVGLTLARSLVEMHGGRIAARSDGPGLGATFTVHLPRVSAPANVPFELAIAGRVPVRRRVLVVDDNVDAAASLAALLRLEGLDAREAHDGAAALEVARHFEPDVAFVDLNMPGMNGTALAAELRAQPWATALHLVALTGMGQKSDVEATRAAGFDAHLTKPAAPDDLLAHARGMAEAGDALRAAG